MRLTNRNCIQYIDNQATKWLVQEEKIESNIKCRLKRRVSNIIDLYDVHVPQWIEIRAMKKMTLSLSHSLKWNSQIWDKDQCKTAFCIAKAQTRTNNQSTASKTQIEPSNSNHSASKPENQPHPEMRFNQIQHKNKNLTKTHKNKRRRQKKLTGLESINEVRLILVREES